MMNTTSATRASVRGIYRAKQPRLLSASPQPMKRYHAAELDRISGGSGGWWPKGTDHNRLIAQANPILRARVRDLVRNFPPFGRACRSISAFVVGKGSRFQSLAHYPDGTPNLKARRKIEDRFRGWMDDADVARKLHFYEMQGLAKRQESECGESLFRFVQPRRRGRHPFALQMHEAEELTSFEVVGKDPDTEIFQGVEYDALTGEPLGYHFQSSANLSTRYTTWREPAENCLHIFDVLRPNQMRGVSPFAPAVLCARDMADYTESELDSARLAARWLAFVKQDATVFGRKMPGAVEREDVEDMESAIIDYLRPGEEMQFAQNPGRPGDSFDRFGRFVLRMVAITVDLPYEVLSGDYLGINYTTSKASRNDFSMFLVPQQFRLEQHLIRPVFHRWLDYEALTQDYLPGYFDNPLLYRRAMWIPAGMPSVDPLRDGKSDIDAVTAGFKSPQQVILARGGDPEEVVMQRKEWARLCDEHGVDATTGGVNTAMANNPAKLGAEEQLPINADNNEVADYED